MNHKLRNFHHLAQIGSKLSVSVLFDRFASVVLCRLSCWSPPQECAAKSIGLWGSALLKTKRNFASFFSYSACLQRVSCVNLSAVQIHQQNTRIILGRGLGGDKVLWAAQMCKAQLTRKEKRPKKKKPLEQTPALNHSFQHQNLLLTNAVISHIWVLPGFQVIELVCYGRQIEMTAGHIKCGSFHPEAELQAISEELNCHVP